MKIIEALLNTLIPNNYNPNDMDPTKEEQLRKTIKKTGYTQPIVARKDEEGKLIIVDGEHRWKVMKDEPEFAGPQQVVIVDSTEDLAKIQTLNHNIIRGEMDTIKMSAIIKDLMVSRSAEDLEEDLGMTSDEIKDLEQLTNFDIGAVDNTSIDDLEKSILADHDQSAEKSFSVILTKAESALFEEAKKYLPKDVDTNNDIVCIVKLIRIFLVSKGVDIKKIIQENTVDTASANSSIGENSGPKISAPGTVEEEIISEEPLTPAL